MKNRIRPLACRSREKQSFCDTFQEQKRERENCAVEISPDVCIDRSIERLTAWYRGRRNLTLDRQGIVVIGFLRQQIGENIYFVLSFSSLYAAAHSSLTAIRDDRSTTFRWMSVHCRRNFSFSFHCWTNRSSAIDELWKWISFSRLVSLVLNGTTMIGFSPSSKDDCFLSLDIGASRSLSLLLLSTKDDRD